MTHDLILQHMQGATQHQPVTLDELASKTGLLPDTISMILDQMQNTLPAVINKVKVIKNGQTEIIVWPTGAIQPTFWRDFKLAGSKTPPPKRVETNPNHQPKEPAMDDTMKATPARARAGDEPQPRSLQILRYIEQHPGCSTYEVQKALKITAPACYLKPYIAAGYVVSSQNKVEGRRPSNSIRLAPGISADELYKIRRKLNAGTEKPQSAAPTETVQSIGAEEIPRFVKQPEPDSPVYYAMKNTEDKLRQAIAAIYEELPAGGDISIARLIDGELSINYHMFGMDDIIEIGDDIDHLAEVIRAHRTLNKHRSAA